jgi:hypothetical protein
MGTVLKTRLSAADAGVRARELYRTQIKQALTEQDARQFLEIDILSGDFEVDADEDAVHDRLVARRPNGHFVLMRADGSPAGTFGFAY